MSQLTNTEGEVLSWQDAVAMGLTPVNANDGDKPLKPSMLTVTLQR